MVDTVRGVVRIRAWPKKRGPPKSENQKFWVDWFTQANLLAKYADPIQQVRAMEMTKGSGLYPRDVLLMAMRGSLYWWADATGWKWFSMASIQGISDSLDVLAQTVGSVLVRATDRWRTPTPGVINDVLTLKGTPAIPEWVAAAGGGVAFGAALVTKTGNQAVVKNTWTAMIYNAEVYDTDAIHDNAVNPTRLTVPTGWNKVRLLAGIIWASNNTGQRIISIQKNGAWVTPRPSLRTPGLGNASACIVSPPLDVVATDYFEFMVFQNTSGNLNALGPSDPSYFAMERVT